MRGGQDPTHWTGVLGHETPAYQCCAAIRSSTSVICRLSMMCCGLLLRSCPDLFLRMSRHITLFHDVAARQKASRPESFKRDCWHLDDIKPCLRSGPSSHSSSTRRPLFFNSSPALLHLRCSSSIPRSLLVRAQHSRCPCHRPLPFSVLASFFYHYAF